MHADAHRKPDAFRLCQVGIQPLHGVQDAQARAHGPLGVVFVGLGVAKVHQQPIAQILGDSPVKALEHLDASGLIGEHHLAEVFRVELTGEADRVHEVAEQHRELAPFGVGGWQRSR